jgi:Tol biopolymer transport system component/predicted Ser/Thr protein kinase
VAEQKMTSWVGKSIAHYRVTAMLGAGGMGEVYRASDSRLGREVAVKVLPVVLARDPERMARFEREAKLLASLSHANIAGIFGLEETDGTRALVMELVEGPTLAESVAKGPLPLDEALAVAKQIAEALEYAHEHSIIHRDLKPANVKLAPDGGVKVLDFGLAKALSDDASVSGSDSSMSPTLTAASTNLGVILGTAAYMSPEQAKGKTVDRRADIWAFGAVLFEMLSGRQAFVGETVSETLASVMKDEPDWSTLPGSTPPRVRDLLRRCLAKDPRHRLRDIGDARIRIEEEIAGAPDATDVGTVAAAKARAFPKRVLSLVAAAAAASGLLGGYLLHRPASPPLFRARLTFPDGMRLDEENASVAISPDGRVLALAAAAKGQDQQLWLRRLDSDETSPVAGTAGATYPFWSPDGRYLAFFADHKLKRVPATGGTVQTICNAVEARGGSWSKNGVIAFSPGPLAGLLIVSASGGTPREVTTLERSGRTHRLPCFLPDGKHLLFVAGSSSYGLAQVECLDIETKVRTPVMKSESEVRYLETGHVAYLIDRNLVVRRFDPSSLKLSGEPVPVAESVQLNVYRYAGGWDISRHGALVYTTGAGVENGLLTWFDLDGRELGTLGSPNPVTDVRVSPDGQRVVTVERAESYDLWIWDVARAVRTRFTFGPGPASNPVWSTDGRTVYFAGDGGAILAKSADGASAARKIMEAPNLDAWPTTISPEGTDLLLLARSRETGNDIWVKTLADDAEPRKLFESATSEVDARLSPDGRWILVTSDESGRNEVYVYPYPSLASRWQVSSEGAEGAEWLADGRAIIYRTPDHRLMKVDLDASGSSLRIGEARKIFGGRTIEGPAALAPDGRRLLVAVPQAGRTLELHLVTDWRIKIEGHAGN